ncbi:unnamed protein product (mitochondrion) [Plasmodiophora brassicae]|uniref:Uncharacterized protein n=1 Tax=Plasmodiophora brassicae TaxID=37360 RepID=A0A0G4IJ43_PLABS|nr:hypothetical protein PBRA_003955 [Plasmodiophora brassicae]SPQ96362.1 unnamed protein product [Plasmodiophora brassicae]
MSSVVDDVERLAESRSVPELVDLIERDGAALAVEMWASPAAIDRVRSALGPLLASDSPVRRRVLAACAALDDCIDRRRITCVPCDLLIDPITCATASFALFERLPPAATVQGAADCLQALRAMYGLPYSQLFANVISSQLRAVLQRKSDFMAQATYLLHRLPLVFAHLERNRGHTFHEHAELNDIESGLCALKAFPGMTRSPLNPSTTWFDVLLDAFAQSGLIDSDRVRSSMRLPPCSIPRDTVSLPPLVAHGDAIVCSSAEEFSAVVESIANTPGSDLTTDLIPELIDLAFGRPEFVRRLQSRVVDLLPRIISPSFSLRPQTLCAVLTRLSTEAAVGIVSCHGKLPVLLSALLDQVKYCMRANLVDRLESYSHVIDIASRAQLLLLYCMRDSAEPTGSGGSQDEIKHFCANATSSKPPEGEQFETIKNVGVALVHVTSHNTPEITSWGDALRLAAAAYPIDQVVLAVRHVILPNMYSKMVEQDKYIKFLRVLLISFPILLTPVQSYFLSALRDDIQHQRPVTPHLSVWLCIMSCAQRLNMPIVVNMYRDSVARALVGIVNLDQEFANSLGSGFLISLVRTADFRAHLVKHTRYLLKSHTTTMSSLWKDLSAHTVLFRCCLEKLGPTAFTETVVHALFAKQPDQQAEASPGHAHDMQAEKSARELCAAIIAVSGGVAHVHEMQLSPTDCKLDMLVCALCLILAHASPLDYDRMWDVLIEDLTGSKFDHSSLSMHAALALTNCEPAMEQWRSRPGSLDRLSATLTSNDRRDLLLPFLDASNPDHQSVARSIVSETCKRRSATSQTGNYSLDFHELVDSFRSILDSRE